MVSPSRRSQRLLLALGLVAALAGGSSIAWGGSRAFGPWPALTLKLKNPDLAIRVGGRLMIDGTLGSGRDLVQRHNVEVRRGRVFLSLKLKKEWRVKTSIELSDGHPVFKDTWLDYTSSAEHMGFRIGQFQEPFGLENLISSKYLTFMERALPIVMVPRYHLGFGLHAKGSFWTAAGGVFAGSINNFDPDPRKTGWGSAVRLTLSPLHRRRRVLHFGISGLFREPGSVPRFRFRGRPELDLVKAPLIDSRSIGRADHLLGLGVEAAGVWGPFSLQGEYLRSFVNRDQGRRAVTGDGWYAYASWFPTGESRPYIKGQGLFGRIKPRHRWGALELGARLSSLTFDSNQRRAGRGRAITLGANWYLTSQLRLMLNYVRTSENNRSLSSRVDLVGMRFQLDF